MRHAGSKESVVLVVEDDEQTRELYRHIIKAAGHDVVVVADGLAALRRIDIEPPHVIVLDLLLPRLGGIDVYQELRANPDTKSIPVIVVTGAETLLEVNEADFDYFLRKPVTPELLVSTIDDALRRAQPAGRA